MSSTFDVFGFRELRVKRELAAICWLMRLYKDAMLPQLRQLAILILIIEALNGRLR